MTQLQIIWLASILIGLFIPAVILYAIVVYCYYTDPMYRAQYGKPPGWPFKKGNF